MSDVLQNPSVEGQSDEQNVQQDTDVVYEIPNFGDVSLKELQEWKNGYMRQADYTRKTQELAEQKKNLFNQPVPQSSPSQPSGNDLEKKVEKMHIEMELGKLKGRYDDFNEIAVLDKAIELINKGNKPESIDFEMLYKATREVDETKIREQILKELTANTDTSSLIGNGTSNPPSNQQITLTPDEDKVRLSMGISVEDWVKYR